MNEEVYKGCSTFSLAEDIKCDVVHNAEGSDGHIHEYGVCKETCSGSNCNTLHSRPCIPTAGDDCSNAIAAVLSLFAVIPLLFVL